MNELKFNLVKNPKYINKKFKIRFQVINKGNTKRILKFISNNTSFDNDKLTLNPFEKREVIINCKLNKISKNPYISIFAESKNGDKYNILNKKLILLNHNEQPQKLKNILSINYKYQKNKLNKYWRIKTFFKKQSYLTLQKNYFRLHYKNKNNLLEIGNKYINNFIRLGDNNKSLKFSYQSNSKRYKKIIYTNFNSEYGIGGYYKDKNQYYYLELKSINNKINHYFKGRLITDNIVYNIKNYRKNKNVLYYLELEKTFKNNDRFKTGLYLKENNNIKKKYFRYINDRINNKIIYGYSIKNTDYYNRKKIIYINEYNNNNETFKFIYEINNYFYKKNKNFLEWKYTNNKYRLNIRYDDYLKNNNIKFKLSRYIKKNPLRTLAIIDNYNGLRIGLENKFEYTIKGQKKITFKGYYSYNFKNSNYNSNIKLGLSIPFSYKNLKRNKLIKVVVKGNTKNLSGIVFDINNKKVKTNKNGNFSIKVDQNKVIKIKLVDLGNFTGKYFLKPQKQVIKNNFNVKEIEFNLVKFINFKVDFKRSKTSIEKYIDINNNELAYLRLYNKENEYIKKYEGGQEIYFNKIKPGKYKLDIKILKSAFEYSINRQDIMINSNNNRIVIKKSLKTSNKQKEKHKLNDLKIKKK